MIRGKREGEWNVKFTFPRIPGETPVRLHCQCGAIEPFTIVGIKARVAYLPVLKGGHAKGCRWYAQLEEAV